MVIYTYSKWLKIGITFCLLILIGVFGALIFMPFFDDKTAVNSIYIIAPISIPLIILCLLGIRDLFVSNVLITNTFISVKNTLFVRKLRIEEIQGYKKVEHYILIYPKGRFKKRIKISDYISDNGEIYYWLQDNFIDLNSAEEEKEEKEYYRNPEYGMSIQEKDILLRKAQLTAKCVNILSIIITVLFLFLSKYLKNEYFANVLVFLPLIIILIVIFFRGIIKYDEKREDEKTLYPSVLWGFLSPIFGLLLHVMFSINILKYDSIWNLLFYSTLITFFLCIYGSKEYKLDNAKVIGTIVSLFLFSALYCYSLIIVFNVFFDSSISKSHQAFVIEKRVSKGKTTSYYFKLFNEELSKKEEEYNVSSSLFESKNVGDNITVLVKQGKLNIPYYKIE